MRLLDHRKLVGVFHQLEDLRAHRILDDAQQRLRPQLRVAVLRAPDAQPADAALVVGGDRHRVEDALDLVVGEALLHEAPRAARPPAPARRGRPSCPAPPHRPAAGRPARTRPPCRSTCTAPAWRSPRPASACAPGSARGSSLRPEARPGARVRGRRCARRGLRLQRLADHDGVDCLVHDLLETRR